MGPRIMIVDGDPGMGELFTAILTDAGYEALVCPLGAECLADIERLAPALIILDHMWGERPLGWALLQRLKADPATAFLPVVLCTTAARRLLAEQAYLQRHDIPVIPKPFDIEPLLDAVRRRIPAPAHTYR